MLRAGRPEDADVLTAIHRTARAAAMPWLPDLHTPEEDRVFFADVVLTRHRIEPGA